MKRLTCLILAAAAGACSDDSAHSGGAGADPSEHACQQVTEVGTRVDAAASGAEPPLLLPDEEPYTVTLPSDGAGYAGAVQIEGPADLLLFLQAEAVATSFGRGDDGANFLPQPAPNASCPEVIREHYDLEIQEAATYTLWLGPSTEPELWLSLLEADGHAH